MTAGPPVQFPPPARPSGRPFGLGRRRWRVPGPRSLAWPLLLYLVVALVPLWPLWPRELVKHGEIWQVTAGVAEAKRALREGQFPLRVAPFQNGGARYPLFQFYGNLPFTAAGLVNLVPGVSPYAALKATLYAGLVYGALFTCRCARRLARRPLAAALAGLVFLTAPYLFTDLHARGAVAEAIALCLLPAAVYYTDRCFASPRPRFVAAAALAWAAVGLSHNITYLYGAAFVGLYVLLGLRPRRREPRRRTGR